jgi:hypothetical protein
VGELPIAFEEGGCSIEFSNVLRRGLTIQLSHTQIIRDLLLGLNTPPAWGARLFLTPLDDGTYGAQLGGTATILSQAEAIDLCAAVDKVGAAYKCSLVEVETLLETWEFQPVETEYGRGFQLMALPSELWRQMHAFVEGHDYGDGNSPWHIFERFGPAIRICANPQHLDSAILWPIYDGSWSRGAVHVIYLAPQWALERMREGADFDWKSLIGPVGTWTAAFTKQWLQQKLIPMVRGEHKPQPAAVKRSEAFSDLDQTRPNYRPFELLRSARDFVPYLYDVHHWIARYPTKRLPAALLRPFYVAFADLVGGADEKILASHYVLSRLGTIELTCDRHPKPAVEMLEKGSVQQRSAASVDSLHWNVERIGSTEYEATPNAAYLTRVFTYIIETADLSPNQAQLNAAKHQLRLLWEQRRFEERYVFRALGFTVTA